VKSDSSRDSQKQKLEFLPITEVPAEETSQDAISDESDSKDNDYSLESGDEEDEDIPPQYNFQEDLLGQLSQNKWMTLSLTVLKNYQYLIYRRRSLALRRF